MYVCVYARAYRGCEKQIMCPCMYIIHYDRAFLSLCLRTFSMYVLKKHKKSLNLVYIYLSNMWKKYTITNKCFRRNDFVMVTFLCVNVHVYINSCIHTQIHVIVYAYVQYVERYVCDFADACVCVYTYAFVCIFTVVTLLMHMHACMCVCVYIYTYIPVYTYVGLYLRL